MSLVQDLRDAFNVSDISDWKLLAEAADRIEALEAALRLAKEYVCDIHALREINAALAPEQDK